MTQTYGYAGKILRVDLSSGSIAEVSTMDYTDRFIGGRGIAAKIYWDEVSPEVSPFDPENRIIFMLGPLAGIPGLAGSRWTVCGKSPTTDPGGFSYSNLGGRWGSQLKFAGYDGIVIQGKSDKPVYLLIEDGAVEIRDASALWGKGTTETREILKEDLGSKVAIVACGPAGENMVTFAGILADNDAAGQCGFGAVMGSKRLKAIAVRGSGKVAVASPEKLDEIRRYVRELRGSISPLGDQAYHMGKRKKDVCYGCVAGGCHRQVRIAEDGAKHKYFCGLAITYTTLASLYYGDLDEMPAYEMPLRYAIMIDEYGLDSHSLFMVMVWLQMCCIEGILNDENTGIPLSEFGSLEYVETITKKISLRDGFGDILAGGLSKAADSVGAEAKKLITEREPVASRDGRVMPYDPRLHIPHGLLYAMEPTLGISLFHEMAYTLFRWLTWANKTYDVPFDDSVQMEGSNVTSDVFRRIAKKFWGSELAADFSTYDGKAMAAKKIQDRTYVKESLILCDQIYPILHAASADGVGDPAIESRIFSAVTGKEANEEEFNLIGERIFNLQRAILAREGHRGRESDTLPEVFHTIPICFDIYNPHVMAPGRDGEAISREGVVVDRENFEKLKGEYYQLRGWDVATGLQTKTKLKELGLEDIIENLEQEGLVV